MRADLVSRLGLALLPARTAREQAEVALAFIHAALPEPARAALQAVLEGRSGGWPAPMSFDAGRPPGAPSGGPACAVCGLARGPADVCWRAGCPVRGGGGGRG